MERVEIISGDFRFTARLLTEQAPKTCAEFKKMLPLKTQFIHVRWSGEGVWLPMGDERSDLTYENHTSHPAAGEMLFHPGGISEREIILSYGRCLFGCQYGQLAGNHFLTIEEGLDRLYEFGRKTLYDGAQDVEIRLIEG